MKQLGAFLLPPGWVHCRITPNSKFTGTHLYTWVKRGNMRVKCLAQEHNRVPQPGLEPGQLDPKSRALTIRPLHLPQNTFPRFLQNMSKDNLTEAEVPYNTCIHLHKTNRYLWVKVCLNLCLMALTKEMINDDMGPVREDMACIFFCLEPNTPNHSFNHTSPTTNTTLLFITYSIIGEVCT